MKCVFLYGPPAVGKLTVAQELGKTFGYKLFHNHLSLDLAESFFEWGSKEFWDLVRSLRLGVVSSVTKSDIKGLVFTFVYNGTKDEDKFIDDFVSAVSLNKGKVYFVNLIAKTAVLKKRVTKPSRKKYSKIDSVKNLANALKKNNRKSINRKPHLVIDNTKISAKESALLIHNFLN